VAEPEAVVLALGAVVEVAVRAEAAAAAADAKLSRCSPPNIRHGHLHSGGGERSGDPPAESEHGEDHGEHADRYARPRDHYAAYEHRHPERRPNPPQGP
jgi:hypothetical protein